MKKYTAGIVYERSDEELIDPFLSWNRDDKAFFASGACHILAHMFCTLHDHEGYKVVHIKPHKGFSGNHMYASNGKWAFDFDGWTLEEDLLEVHQNAYRERNPDWQFDKVVVNENFLDYIKKNNHRPPEYFPFLPWERAYKYIQKFSSKPPNR